MRETIKRIKFDTKLTFENHIADISSKGSSKVYTLARVAPYIDLSQFNYCPLVWMCYKRTTNRKINRFH